MPEIPINVIQTVISLEQLCNEVAKTQRNVRYLVNGQIDFENIRARSIKAENIETETLTANEIAANAITTVKLDAEAVTTGKISAGAVETDKLHALAVTAEKVAAGAIETDKIKAGAVTADKITVTELSAITAYLGHVISGLIESVTIIGSEIMTNTPGNYPRVVQSTTGKLFGAYANANQSVEIITDHLGNNPAFYLTDGAYKGFVYQSSQNLLINTPIGNGSNIQINSGADLYITASGTAKTSFSKLVDTDVSPNRSLKQKLDAKADASTASGSFTTADGKTVIVVNGVIVSIV